MMDKGGVQVIFGVPWWVLILILLIFISGIMAFRAMRAEKMLEQQFIEREGEIYIQRMHEEKKRRANNPSMARKRE